MAGIGLASAYEIVDPATLGLFSVMWLALPLANGLLDFVSLGVSHALASFLTRSPRRGVTIILIGLFDFLFAIGLMAITVLAIGIVLEALAWVLGVETFDSAFLVVSAADPWQEGLWLTIMVLSTTFWTLLHYICLVAPICASMLTAHTIDAATQAQLDAARRKSNFDPTVSAFLPMRYLLFFGAWGVLAVCPFFAILTFPVILDSTLSFGLFLLKILF